MSTTQSGNKKHTADTIALEKLTKYVSKGLRFEGKIDNLLYVKQYKPTYILLKPLPPREQGYYGNIKLDTNFMPSVVMDLYGISADAVTELLKNTNTTERNPFGVGKTIANIPTTMQWFKVLGTTVNVFQACCIVNAMRLNISNPNSLPNIAGVDVNVGTDMVFFALGFIPYVGWVITGVYVVTKIYAKVEHNQEAGEFLQDEASSAIDRLKAEKNTWIDQMERLIFKGGFLH